MQAAAAEKGSMCVCECSISVQATSLAWLGGWSTQFCYCTSSSMLVGAGQDDGTGCGQRQQQRWGERKKHWWQSGGDYYCDK